MIPSQIWEYDPNVNTDEDDDVDDMYNEDDDEEKDNVDDSNIVDR